MLYAEIRRSGKIVPAGKASPHGDYRCPICKAEVFLKAGQVYTAHFAHMPGQGKPECDEFHPPGDLRHQWLTPAPQAPRRTIDRLLLSIELEPDDARYGLRRWDLRLTVPRAYHSHGEIRIDLGAGDIRRVSLASLLLGSQTYRADLGTTEFGAVWVSPEVRLEFRQAVEHRIAGLSQACATVFAATPDRFKPRCGTLRWGESYYFVWSGDKPKEIPAALLHQALADNQDWSCCLVALPDRVDSDVAAWLEKTCDLQVLPAKREWALVHPAPHGVDDHGDLQIYLTAVLLLAIKPVDDAGEITCVSGRQSVSLKLLGAESHVVEISGEREAAPQSIHLTWDTLPLNSLATRAYPESTPELAVVFEVGTAPNKTPVALHRASSHAKLRRVRNTEDKIWDVRADPRLRGEIRFRRGGEFEWQCEALNFSNPGAVVAIGHASLSITQVALINELLKDRSLDVAIDFGPYGEYSVTASTAGKVPQSNVRMPRRLRARVEWLCKASHAFTDVERRSISRLDDAALLRHLSTLKIPVSLLANWRALTLDLRKIECGLRT